MQVSRKSLSYPKICGSLGEFKALLASRARWEYMPADETYRFYTERWPQPTFIRITKANLEALDVNLIAALDYYGAQSDAPGRLIATLDVWYDVNRLIYMGDEQERYGYDIEKITSVTGVSATGVEAVAVACRLLQIKPNLWVVDHNFASCQLELSSQWVDTHYPSGMARMGAGLALGLSDEDIAGLLPQPAKSEAITLPPLEHGALR